MNKILLLGSGLVAHPMIRYLLDKKYTLTVASNTPDRAAAMIAGNPAGNVLFWEAGDENGLDRMVAEHDLTVRDRKSVV